MKFRETALFASKTKNQRFSIFFRMEQPRRSKEPADCGVNFFSSKKVDSKHFLIFIALFFRFFLPAAAIAGQTVIFQNRSALMIWPLIWWHNRISPFHHIIHQSLSIKSEKKRLKRHCRPTHSKKFKSNLPAKTAAAVSEK